VTLLLALLAVATAGVTVTASIESVATVEVDGECARLVTNEPDAIAWADDRPLVADGTWTCPADPPREQLAGWVRLRRLT